MAFPEIKVAMPVLLVGVLSESIQRLQNRYSSYLEPSLNI